MLTLYLNASLWSWSAYLILALANCGIGKKIIVLLCHVTIIIVIILS